MKFKLDKFLTKECIEKLSKNYFPCPDQVINIIKTLVKSSEVGGCLLDNCAGTGEAAVALANAFNLTPYMIEPHFGRFIACSAKSANTLCASAGEVILVGTPTLWFFNPPFDPSDSTSLLEKSIFEASVKYALKEGTLCIMILAERNIRDNYFISSLIKPKIRKFPKKFFEDYQQVVIIGYAKGDSSNSKMTIEKIYHDDVSELLPHEFNFSFKENASSFLTFSKNPTGVKKF